MSTTNESSSATAGRTGTASSALRTSGLAILIAGIANTVLGVGADAAGVAMAVKGFGADVRESIPVFAYFVSTIIGGAVGFVLMLIMKRSGATKKTFFIVTGVLTVISLVSPLTADASSGTKIVLEVLHVVAAAIIIPALARGLKD
jgi:low temperature requirement protein LtrA